jgi:aquaporin Z
MSQSSSSEQSEAPASGLTAKLITRSLAELAGTFLAVTIVLFGGAWGSVSGAALVVLILASFFGYGIAAALFGRISGGHFNPAVTLAAALSGRIGWLDALCYVIAQVIGGIAAAALLLPIFPEVADAMSQASQQTQTRMSDSILWQIVVNRYGTSQIHVSSTIQMAIIVEFLGSLIAVAAVVSVIRTDGTMSRMGAAISGFGYAAGAVVTGMVTGTGLNPARSTGAAIFAQVRGVKDALSQLWIFWLVPLLAGAIVGLILAIAQSGSAASASVAASPDAHDAKASDEEDVDSDSADDISEAEDASLKNAAHRVSMDQKASHTDDERDIADFNTVIKQDTDNKSSELEAEKEASERNDSSSDSDTNIDFVVKQENEKSEDHKLTDEK